MKGFITVSDGMSDHLISTAHIVAVNGKEIVQLLLIYHSRGDGDQDKKGQMKRALRNFKPLKDIDLDAIMKYYKFDL